MINGRCKANKRAQSTLGGAKTGVVGSTREGSENKGKGEAVEKSAAAEGRAWVWNMLAPLPHTTCAAEHHPGGQPLTGCHGASGKRWSGPAARHNQHQQHATSVGVRGAMEEGKEGAGGKGERSAISNGRGMANKRAEPTDGGARTGVVRSTREAARTREKGSKGAVEKSAAAERRAWAWTLLEPVPHTTRAAQHHPGGQPLTACH